MPSKINFKNGPIVVAGASAGGLSAFVSLIRQNISSCVIVNGCY